MLLHEELRRAREAAGLTQAQLADLAGIPRNQIVRAEKGENITLETLRKIIVHLPVENLTLLEGVKLGFDNLPQAERLYATASKMMLNLSAAFMAALETTMEARLARDTAREKKALEPGDELLPLRALKSTLLELNERLREDPDTLEQFDQGLAAQGQGSTNETIGSVIAMIDGTVENDGPTVENNGPTVEKNGPTVENNGSTVENDGPTVENNGPTVEKNG